jgi:hypothetical protein
MSDEKPNALALDGLENVACAMYFTAHYHASHRLMARDLHEKHPDEWSTFEEALEHVERGMAQENVDREESEKRRRTAHMRLCMMGGFGDLSEKDIP